MLEATAEEFEEWSVCKIQTKESNLWCLKASSCHMSHTCYLELTGIKTVSQADSAYCSEPSSELLQSVVRF